MFLMGVKFKSVNKIGEFLPKRRKFLSISCLPKILREKKQNPDTYIHKTCTRTSAYIHTTRKHIHPRIIYIRKEHFHLVTFIT